MFLILQSLTFYLIPVITAILIGLYFYFTRNFKFWHKLGIPYVKPTPFLGSLKECVLLKKSIGEQLQRIYNQHSDKPYVGIFSFDKPSLLIRDPELVKNVLVKDFQTFMDRTFSFDDTSDPLLGKNLATLKGQLWRHLRTNLTAPFSLRKIKMMFYLVDICGKELGDCLEKATAGGKYAISITSVFVVHAAKLREVLYKGWIHRDNIKLHSHGMLPGSTVEVKQTMARYTSDVIASCAFGINCNSLKDPDSEFGRHIREIGVFSVQKGLAMLLAFFAPYLNRIFRLKFVGHVTDNYVRQIIWDTVQYREKHGLVRNDFLDCMIELRKADKDEAPGDVKSAKNVNTGETFKIDGDLFVAQAFIFLAAGYETSAGTLSFALYELALHPEIQQILRAEILQVLSEHDGKLTYDSVQDMSYLDRVVSETLRKYPSVPFVERKCCSDYELPAINGNGTITLPAGTGVYIPPLALHHDPTYFPEPQKFDPDRFTEQNKRSRPKYTYIPFGEGPRMCIGMQFGLMQVKTGLCHILSRFEVSPCKDTPVRIVFEPKSFLLQMKGGIQLSFNRM